MLLVHSFLLVMMCLKQVSTLSGARETLALCKILKKKPNLLILDEPTNHMDIVEKKH